MPANDLIGLRGALETVVREAGELARSTARGPLKQWTKEDSTPVTEGDIAVNELLRERLVIVAPDAGWVSEETEKDPSHCALPLVWIVDPIDGTRAYISGRPDWTISVALAEQGRPIAAAVYAPVTDEMFLASSGGGATLNSTPIKVSAGDTFSGAKLAGPNRYLNPIAGLLPGIIVQPRLFSLALRVARVAQGEIDAAFAASGSHDWDLAAADLLVHEAGGVLTDFLGQPLKYNRLDSAHGALIAAGRGRHSVLIGLVRDRKAEFA